MSYERIARDPAVMLGKPVIKGTRITVDLILREIAGGFAVADVIAAYPGVTEADIRAALAYAADYVAHESRMPAE